MKRKDKYILLAILGASALLLLIFMLAQGLIRIPSISKDNSSSLGSITQTAEDYDYTQDCIQQFDEVIESDTQVFTQITNIDLVLDILTLKAIGDLDKDLSAYLLLKGYSGETMSLTISQSSIVYDKSYPYFELNIDGTEKYIRASYKLETLEWEFSDK